MGTAHSNFTMNYTPWGLDNAIPIGVSSPGTISTGSPFYPGVPNTGTACTNCFAVPKGTGPEFQCRAEQRHWPALTVQRRDPQLAKLRHCGQYAHQSDRSVETGLGRFRTGKNSSLSRPSTRDCFPGFLFSPPASIPIAASWNYVRIFTATASTQRSTNPSSVPTINPYYPTGAPNGLKVSYDLGFEVPPIIPAYELSSRYQFGLNLDLPFGWSGQIYDSHSRESNQYTATTVNDNSVNVALGNTQTGVFGNAITKPA